MRIRRLVGRFVTRLNFQKAHQFSATAEACRISTANRVRYAVQRRGDCATLSEQAVFALGSPLARRLEHTCTASDGLV
jgi:hypothetical protein